MTQIPNGTKPQRKTIWEGKNINRKGKGR